MGNEKSPARAGLEDGILRKFFDSVARMDGFKDWADLCRWDVGDYIYKESTFLPGLFVMWYGVVILLRILGLPLRLPLKAVASRIRAARALDRKAP